MTVALGMQIGVNFANDYFDAVRGVDTAERAGPRRLTAAGLISGTSMKIAMTVSFAVAAIAGIVLAAAASPWLILVGAACVVAALGYSGGPRPYADKGLGEVAVLTFFGFVATVGSAYVQIERVSAVSLAASLPVGALAAALLVCNNIRDIATDASAGKRTLAVRLGVGASRRLFVATLAVAGLGVAVVAVVKGDLWPLLALAATPLGVWVAITELRASAVKDHLRVLAGSARLLLAASALLSLGLWL